MSKKNLTEAEIRTRYITPAIKDTAEWDINHIREEFYIDAGRIYPAGDKGKRGKRKFADYVLFSKGNKPLAVVEAKDNNHSVGAGMQQALEYARNLDAPFAYSSNGDGFVEHDRTKPDGPLERELGLHDFPAPDKLWARLLVHVDKSILTLAALNILSGFIAFKQLGYCER